MDKKSLLGALSLNDNLIKETYTPLTYIECSGEQYINLDYVVQEDDIIEMDFTRTTTTAVDKALFGTNNGTDYLQFTIYNANAYYRFGNGTSDNASGGGNKYKVIIKKSSVDINGLSETIGFTSMPNTPLYLFASNNNNTNVSMYGYCKSKYFKITKESGNIVMELRPCKRNSDGKIGFLDIVSGNFFINNGSGQDFIPGNEINIPNGYELIDYVTFSKNKLYDLGIISSTDKIDVMFARNETTSTTYMYGIVTSPHTASVTAYLSSSGAWRFGTSYKGISMTDKFIHRVEIYNGTTIYDFTSSGFTKSTFTTPDTVVLGGYRTASGSLSKTYQGKIYYIRIYNNNQLRLDWYPCKNPQGVEGFWDCVSNQFINIM